MDLCGSPEVYSDQNEVGTVTPFDCAAGFECIDGEPFICQPGTYNDAENQACSTCSDGYTSYSEGSLTCQACLEGEICRNGLKNGCERGYLKNLKNGTDPFGCSICQSGHYCPTNLNEPVPCPMGTFNSENGSFIFSDCQICPVGSYCPAGSSKDIKCGDEEIFYCPEGSALPKRYEQTLQLPRSGLNFDPIRSKQGSSVRRRRPVSLKPSFLSL